MDDFSDQERLQERVGDDLVLDLAGIGVHVGEIHFGMEPPIAPMALVTGYLSRLAFVSLGQDGFDDEFDEITERIVDDQYEAIRREIMDEDT